MSIRRANNNPPGSRANYLSARLAGELSRLPALCINRNCCYLLPDLEFSRLESWSRDVSRPVFTSLGLGLGLEPRSLDLGLGLGTSESWSWSWSWISKSWSWSWSWISKSWIQVCLLQLFGFLIYLISLIYSLSNCLIYWYRMDRFKSARVQKLCNKSPVYHQPKMCCGCSSFHFGITSTIPGRCILCRYILFVMLYKPNL